MSCAVHAKGKTALEVAEEIARAASAALPGQPEDLAPAIRDALSERGGTRFNVIIDALDEAASPAQAACHHQPGRAAAGRDMRRCRRPGDRRHPAPRRRR